MNFAHYLTVGLFCLFMLIPLSASASASAPASSMMTESAEIFASSAHARAWERGVIDGYRSIKGNAVTPSIPSRPATVPANVRDVAGWYYREGYKRGVAKAKGG